MLPPAPVTSTTLPARKRCNSGVERFTGARPSKSERSTFTAARGHRAGISLEIDRRIVRIILASLGAGPNVLSADHRRLVQLVDGIARTAEGGPAMSETAGATDRPTGSSVWWSVIILAAFLAILPLGMSLLRTREAMPAGMELSVPRVVFSV